MILKDLIGHINYIQILTKIDFFCNYSGLKNNKLNIYIMLLTVKSKFNSVIAFQCIVHIHSYEWKVAGRKEGNVLFNDVL